MLTKNRVLDNLLKGQQADLSTEEIEVIAEHYPSASVDVEWSFSGYKAIFTE